MKCKNVLGRLSWFMDGMLDDNLASEVSQHLKDCPECDHEFMRLRKLHAALKSMEPVQAPDYLADLVNMKISRAHSQSWWKTVRSALEYRWSRIKTTEGVWYLTRLTGAMATIVLFVAIYSSMNPLYITLAREIPTRVPWPNTQPSQRLALGLQKAFGMPEAQKKPVRSSEARINDLYLDKLGQTASKTAHDDTVSVFTMVDRNGTAKVQNILEYPADDSLLSDFTEMINSAVWRPASQNGRAVDSRQVFIFSKIYVYN